MEIDRQQFIAISTLPLGLEHTEVFAALLSYIETFGIAGGLGEGLKKIFTTHPPLEDRIAALEAQKY